MSFSSSPSFDVWLATERRHLQATRRGRAARGRAVAPGRRRRARSRRSRRRLVRQNPLDENFQALLVRCLAAAGDGVGAARQAAACRELFVPRARRAAGRDARRRDAHGHRHADRAARDRSRCGASRRSKREKPRSAPARSMRVCSACGARLSRPTPPATRSCVRAHVSLWAARSCMPRVAATRRAPRRCTRHSRSAGGRARSLAAAACRELGYVEFLRGRYERALVWLRRAAPLAGDDRVEQARIAIVHGSTLSDTAHYAAAIAMLRDCRTRSPTASATRSRSRMRCRCWAHAAAARRAASRDRRARSIDHAGAAGLDRVRALAAIAARRSRPAARRRRRRRGTLRACLRARLPTRRPVLGRDRRPRPRARRHRAGRDATCRRDPGRRDRALRAPARRLPVGQGLRARRAVRPGGRARSCRRRPPGSTSCRSSPRAAGMRELTVRAHLHRAALGDSASRAAATAARARDRQPGAPRPSSRTRVLLTHSNTSSRARELPSGQFTRSRRSCRPSASSLTLAFSRRLLQPLARWRHARRVPAAAARAVAAGSTRVARSRRRPVEFDSFDAEASGAVERTRLRIASRHRRGRAVARTRRVGNSNALFPARGVPASADSAVCTRCLRRDCGDSRSRLSGAPPTGPCGAYLVVPASECQRRRGRMQRQCGQVPNRTVTGTRLWPSAAPGRIRDPRPLRS